MGQRVAGFDDRLLEIRRFLAGQRLPSLVVLRPNLHGDEVERVSDRIEFGEGLVELRDRARQLGERGLDGLVLLGDAGQRGIEALEGVADCREIIRIEQLVEAIDRRASL